MSQSNPLASTPQRPHLIKTELQQTIVSEMYYISYYNTARLVSLARSLSTSLQKSSDAWWADNSGSFEGVWCCYDEPVCNRLIFNHLAILDFSGKIEILQNKYMSFSSIYYKLMKFYILAGGKWVIKDLLSINTPLPRSLLKVNFLLNQRYQDVIIRSKKIDTKNRYKSKS